MVKRDAGLRAAATIDAAPTFVHGAGRCGECHEKMYDEWERSAHARAASSPLYLAASKTVEDGKCGAACHTPLAARATIDRTIASEGVTCDVCHTLRKPETGGHFDLAINDMVKFGPRCDLKDHYFHRMGCSPDHATSKICGACHQWTRGDIPVFTELADLVDGKQCQDCHMPKSNAPIAVGSPSREGVPHHGWLGATGDLRSRAVTIAVARAGGATTISITNSGAGHYVPAGLPERRLVVEARAGGARHEWVLGRELLDAAGKPAPFWAATKAGADTRIAPGKTAKLVWADAPAGAVEVDVHYRDMAPEFAALLGVASSDVIVARFPRKATKP